MALSLSFCSGFIDAWWRRLNHEAETFLFRQDSHKRHRGYRDHQRNGVFTLAHVQVLKIQIMKDLYAKNTHVSRCSIYIEHCPSWLVIAMCAVW